MGGESKWVNYESEVPSQDTHEYFKPSGFYRQAPCLHCIAALGNNKGTVKAAVLGSQVLQVRVSVVWPP